MTARVHEWSVLEDDRLTEAQRLLNEVLEWSRVADSSVYRLQLERLALAVKLALEALNEGDQPG